MITQKLIDNFFINIEPIIGIINETDIFKNKYDIGHNVIFMTVNCDYECEYCYQKSLREKSKNSLDLVEEDIDKILTSIVKREGNNIPSNIHIYGGEPFLKYDLIKYLIKKAKQYKTFSYSITTNGNILSHEKYIKDFIKFYYSEIKNHVEFLLHISTDGYKNSRRDNEDNSFKLMKYLTLAKIPFAVNYTINKVNAKYASQEMKQLVEEYNMIIKIQTALVDKEIVKCFPCIHDETRSYNCNQINKCFEFPYDCVKEFYKNDLLEILNKYNVPVCDLICDVCQKCNKQMYSNWFYYNKENLDTYLEAGTSTQNNKMFYEFFYQDM